MAKYSVIRNQEVKKLRASGLRNAEVAAQLGIKPASASAMYRYQPTGKKKGRECNGNRERVMEMRAQEPPMTFKAIGEALRISRQGAHALCHYRASDEFRGRG